MRTPNFYDGQFVSAAGENSAFSAVTAGIAEGLSGLFTPGVSGTESATFTLSGLTVTCDMSGVVVMFGDGTVALPLGIANGSTSPNYTVDLSGLVPASGTQTVYIVATPVAIGTVPSIISGPPPGNPDYDPTFTPYSAYLVYRDSFALSGTTSEPTGESIEIGRFTISQGSASLGSFDLDSASRIGVSDVTEWTSTQIVNARSVAKILEGYLALSDTDTQTVSGPVAFTGSVTVPSIRAKITNWYSSLVPSASDVWNTYVKQGLSGTTLSTGNMVYLGLRTGVTAGGARIGARVDNTDLGNLAMTGNGTLGDGDWVEEYYTLPSQGNKTISLTFNAPLDGYVLVISSANYSTQNTNQTNLTISVNGTNLSADQVTGTTAMTNHSCTKVSAGGVRVSSYCGTSDVNPPNVGHTLSYLYIPS